MRRRIKSSASLPITIEEMKDLLNKKLPDTPDLQIQEFEVKGGKILVFFITLLVTTKQLNNNILSPLLTKDENWDTQKILNELPLGESSSHTDFSEVIDVLIKGSVGIYIEKASEVITYSIPNREHRQVERAEKESTVLGPRDAFTESLTTNLNIVRWRLNTSDLVTEKVIIGERIPTEVRLVYLKSLANETDVQTMRQRLKELVVDNIEDTMPLIHFIEDSSTSLFPQFYITELPSRFTYSVSKGRVGVLVDKSPSGFVGPTSLFSFFESTEDVFMRWNVGSFIRLLRFIALIISALLTPAYVAAVTFHYEIIPTPLLTTLGESRAAVPFPPIMEAVLLELLIELLREAGARLPTKVGQTIGIVGGIVIGQAAVAAGLTSNILIIVVAMSALASFTAPSYAMGSTIRVIRFPMIIIAGMIGLIGVIGGVSFIVIHLLRTTSLGRPYLLPAYPLNLKDFDNSFFRLPAFVSNLRSISYRPKDLTRYKQRRARMKKDIDE
ncbi:spore germination protein [Sediminibacillus massiliensis]|uniref:spore germination protein n=1 Tax=Sediminibacillus massiliensis TaxID=1926277 RepID=UPI0009889088|nr:spore germination protein [Sediminibacillus massiliensis]